jgi:hypothetical protein
MTMPHPFFDALQFPWWRPEAGPFHQVLYIVIPLSNDIQRHYHSCGPALLPLSPNNAPHAMWQEALENLTRDFCLRVLCDRLLNEPRFQANVRFRDAVQSVVIASDAPDAGVVTLCLPLVVKISLEVCH